MPRLNIDGDCALSEAEDRHYWNPHSVPYPVWEGVDWEITFNDRCRMNLNNEVAGNFGHIATGFWWDRAFRPLFLGHRIPLAGFLGLTDMWVDLDIRINYAEYEPPREFLRIALASAFKTWSPDACHPVLYTELDFWDSPGCLELPGGNVSEGGDVIFDLPCSDVKEYKVDQIDLGVWKHYSFNLSDWMVRAWGITTVSMGALESVYVVVESDAARAEVEVDNFWVTSLECPLKLLLKIIYRIPLTGKGASISRVSVPYYR